MSLQFNPFSPEFVRDPYPTYDRLREESPIHKTVLGSWLLTRYDDVNFVLKHPRVSSDYRNWTRFAARGNRAANDPEDALARMHASWMLLSDPPYHAKLRAAVGRHLTPASIEKVRAEAESCAERLLAGIGEATTIDIMEAIANPLPVVIISDLLGIPENERDFVKNLSDVIVPTIDPLLPLSVFERGIEAAEECERYWSELLAHSRAHPKDDLLSAMIGGGLTDQEIGATCVLLFLAGHETTVSAIGSAVLWLLRCPNEMEKVRKDPSLTKSAVEEALRFESPLHAVARTPLEDLWIRDTRIPKGDLISVNLGAANRDPQRFPEPNRFRVDRAENPHVAFGSGAHYCIGAPLAKVEAQAALSVLLNRFEELSLVDQEVEWTPSLVLRKPKSIKVVTG